VTVTRRRLPTHAFVDESRRGDSYILAAALIASRDVQLATVTVRGALLRGQQRTHFSDERDRVRRQILDAYCRLPAQVTVAVAEYIGGDDQQARDACLLALLETFEERTVGVPVLDTRGYGPDHLDRRTIARAIRDGGAPDELHYTLCVPETWFGV
jgi:hypothetical protein